MPQRRKYLTNAEKQAAFRLQHPDAIRVLSDETKEKNKLRARCWRKSNPSKLEESKERIRNWAKLNPDKVREAKREWASDNRKHRQFIAIDGEGITIECHPSEPFAYTDDKGITTVHKYTLLSSSLNESVENWKDGISTQGCFEFLWRYRDKGILVAFGSNYDVNMMLRDLPPESLKELWNTNSTHWNGWEISWLKSKMFSLTKDNKRVTLYEVFGYFQASFVDTLLDWKLLEKGSQLHQMLAESKGARNTFNAAQRQSIKKYNLKECELLVKLMDALRDACDEADITPKSWHGAATLAKAMAVKYGVAKHIVTPEHLKPIFLRAYYGGRSQILQQGEFDKAFGHDVSSAYPAALRTLPTSNGKWHKVVTFKPNHPWALYHVKWNCKKNEVLTPFPFRYKSEIYYPLKGEGWYWFPEVETALRLYPKQIEILEGKVFVPENDIKPFAFIDDVYAQRQQFKREGNDAQKALKLGMNSLYGITAQSIGYQGARPPFQNYFYAGYTTSVCRAKVLELAYLQKQSIIAFATDGVFATKRLTKDVSGLGGWETDEIDNLFMLQSGVYAFGFEGDDAQPIKKKSRGFHKKSVNYDELRELWRKEGNTASYAYSERRFMGLGTSLPSLKSWRQWRDCPREINFTISPQWEENPNGVLRIYSDTPKCKMSEAYEPHKSWEEKDKATNESHDD